MRLIDADALLEAMKVFQRTNIYLSVKDLITNAPTVQREGWKLVPIEPTREMLDNAHVNLMRDGEIDKLLKQVYAAMLSAAPTDKE